MNNNEILIEYACYDDVLSNVVREKVFKALDMGIKSISVPVIHMSAISSILPEGIVLSCPIDWPNGRSDPKLRIHGAIKAKHCGATTIDVVASAVLFRNAKEVDFIHDLKSLKSVADDKNMTMRVMLDHRKLENGKQVRGMMKLIKACGIEYIYCATGQYADEISDNIILCNTAQKDFQLSAIANGTLYLPKHLEAARGARLFGARFHSIKALESCMIGV